MNMVFIWYELDSCMSLLIKKIPVDKEGTFRQKTESDTWFTKKIVNMKLLNKGKQGHMCGGQREWEGAHAAEEVNGFKYSPAIDTEEQHETIK